MSEEKRKAWADIDSMLEEFDALPEAEREKLLYYADRRNFETVERAELERLQQIEAESRKIQVAQLNHDGSVKYFTPVADDPAKAVEIASLFIYAGASAVIFLRGHQVHVIPMQKWHESGYEVMEQEIKEALENE